MTRTPSHRAFRSPIAVDRTARLAATTSPPTQARYLAIAALLLVVSAGCHRQFYRQQADAEVYSLLQEKAHDSHGEFYNFQIASDPQSRMFDPFDPDRPPMPRDDKKSHRYMHVVDDKKGYPYWHVNGDTDFVENPEWKCFLPLDESGVLKISSDEAVRLALLHSSDYQQQLETLYLSALDVSAERFSFDTQFFAGHGTRFDAFGRLSPNSVTDGSSSVLDASLRTTEARRFFATGATMVVGLANSLIWQFSSADSHSASTLVNFSLVQPLLQQAGRDRILEALTFSERSLLANVRQMERYQRGFYLDVYLGNGLQPELQRGGVFIDPEAFRSSAAPVAGGYLGLLQQQQRIRNQETNIAALRSSLAQFEAFREAGRIEFIQVEQTRQDLFSSTSQLMESRRRFADDVDDFKETLGLPPTIPLELKDDLLTDFNLIDPELNPLQERTTQLQYDSGRVIVSIINEIDEAGAGFGWTDKLNERLGRLQANLKELQELRKQVLEKYLVLAEEDLSTLRDAVPKRVRASRHLLERLEDVADGNADSADNNHIQFLRGVDASYFDVSELDELPDRLEATLKDVREELARGSEATQAIMNSIEDLQNTGSGLDADQLTDRLRNEVFQDLPSRLTGFSANVLELSLTQARARSESITLESIDIDPKTAVSIARLFRRDWMNARAALVDSWRLIEFNADDLESVLDIVFDADIRNTGDNPIRLRDVAGSIGVGVQFDAPLTRRLERNRYRESLISYQQARRAYYRVDDAVNQTLRAILRQIELNKVNFELRRTALRIAVAQVQAARLELQRPPPIDAGTRGRLSPTTALNLLRALSSLRSAQDEFLNEWVRFYMQRGLLDLNMGTMKLDEQGQWVDPGAIGLEFGYPGREDILRMQYEQSDCPDLVLPEFMIEEGESAEDAELIPAPAPDEMALDFVVPPAGLAVMSGEAPTTEALTDSLGRSAEGRSARRKDAKTASYVARRRRLYLRTTRPSLEGSVDETPPERITAPIAAPVEARPERPSAAPPLRLRRRD